MTATRMPTTRTRPVLLLVALVAFAGCGPGRPGTPAASPPSVPPPPASAVATVVTSSTIPAPTYHRIGAQVPLGKGLVDGASLDGSALYVEAVEPALSKLGCEGQLDPVLFRVPLGGGQREAVMAGDKTVQGVLARGPGGHVAIISGCEEFTSAVVVGTETADGHLNGLRAVPPGPAISRLRSIAWSADGTKLLATQSPATKGQPWPVVTVDPTSGIATTAFLVAAAQVGQVAQLSDGTYVIAADAKVTVRDAAGTTVKATAGGSGFVIGPRSQVIAYGAGGVTVISPDGTPMRTPVHLDPGQAITDLKVSPDGEAVVFSAVVGGVEAVEIATIADGRVTMVAGSPQHPTRPVFTGDGRALAFSLLAGGPASPDVAVIRFGG